MKREKSPAGLACSIACFLSLAAARDWGRLPIPPWAFTLLCLAEMVLLDDEDLLSLLLFLLPFGVSLQISWLAGAAALLYAFKAQLRLSRYSAWILVLGAYELLHWFLPAPFSLSDFCRYSASLGFLGATLLCPPRRRAIQTPLFVFTLGVCASVADLGVQTLNACHWSPAKLLDAGLRMGQTAALHPGAATLSNNQNYVACYCAVAIAVLLVLRQKRQIPELWYAGCLIVCMAGGLATQSRTFLATEIACALLYLCWFPGRKRGVWTLALSAAAPLCLLPELAKALFARLALGMTERWEIMAQYHRALMESALRLAFGVGMQAPHLKLGLAHVPHNSLQELLVSWGVAGTLCFCGFLYGAFRVNAPEGLPREQRFCALPLTALGIFTMALQLMSNVNLMLLLIPAFYALSLSEIGGEKPDQCNRAGL